MFLCTKCKVTIDLPICSKCGNKYEMLRGFSDQIAVPEDKHKLVIEMLLKEFKEKYGEHFDEVVFKGNEEDILLTVYRK